MKNIISCLILASACSLDAMRIAPLLKAHKLLHSSQISQRKFCTSNAQHYFSEEQFKSLINSEQKHKEFKKKFENLTEQEKKIARNNLLGHINNYKKEMNKDLLEKKINR